MLNVLNVSDSNLYRFISWLMVPRRLCFVQSAAGVGLRILLLSSHLTGAAAAHMTKQQLPHTCSTPVLLKRHGSMYWVGQESNRD